LNGFFYLPEMHLAFAHRQVIFRLHGMNAHGGFQLLDGLAPLAFIDISAGKLVV